MFESMYVVFNVNAGIVTMVISIFGMVTEWVKGCQFRRGTKHKNVQYARERKRVTNDREV